MSEELIELVKPSVLDDLGEIKKIDKSGMLSFCVDAPQHYGKAARLARKWRVRFPEPETIIVAGMGGSAIGGELLKDWARDKVPVPIEVCSDYSLPAYADANTLVLVVSYSGETEESLSAFSDAVKRKCMTVCVSSGGTLREFAGKLDVPHLLVPSGMAPRATLPYLFMPLVVMLERIGLVSSVTAEISETVKILKQVSASNLPERPIKDNFSKTLASNVCGTVPVVYGFGIYRAVAQRLKTQFNENSKNPAKWEFFPELNHNEIVGWEAAEELAKCFSVIFIRDKDEPKPIRQRIETTKEIINEESVKTYEVYASGETPLARMLSTVVIGDFTSIYLAVLRGIDPTPVRTIALLKEKMRQTGVKEKIIRELERLGAR